MVSRTNVNCRLQFKALQGDRSKGLGTETGLLPKEFRAQFREVRDWKQGSIGAA